MLRVIGQAVELHFRIGEGSGNLTFKSGRVNVGHPEHVTY